MSSVRNKGVRPQRNGKYWQAVWRDSRNRRHVKSLGPITRQQALAACQEIATKFHIQPGRRDAGPAPTLKAWVERVKANRAAELNPRTITLDQESIGYLLAFFDPDIRIDAITRTLARDWRKWLTEQKRRGHTLSDATVCRHVRTAKTYFGVARRDDVIGANPFDGLRGTPAATEKDWRQLTEAEVMRLIDHAPSAPWKALLALCSLAGLRRGEALRLEWSDIQWERQRLSIRPEEEKVTTKQRARVVRMEKALETILLDVRESADGALVAPVPANNLHEDATAIIKKAGFEPWADPFHTLRKWRSTSWSQVYPEFIVDSWLGHGPEVARKHYKTVPESFYGERPDVVADLKAEVERLKKALGQEQNT